MFRSTWVIHWRDARYRNYFRGCAIALFVAAHAVAAGLTTKAAKKSIVLHNGVRDVRLATPTVQPDHHAPTILLVARVQAWKGQEMAIRMLAEPVLAGSTPRAVLQIVGTEPPGEEGEYLPGLRQLAAELRVLDQVQFLGERSDVPEILARADVVLNLSQQPDPFPLATLEAMSAGSAIVAGALGGLPEMLADTGILVSPRDPVEVATAVAMLLSNEAARADLASRARTRWELCFSSDRHKEGLAALFAAIQAS